MLGGVFLARAEGVESQAYVIQSQAAQAVAASNLHITTVRKFLQGITVVVCINMVSTDVPAVLR